MGIQRLTAGAAISLFSFFIGGIMPVRAAGLTQRVANSTLQMPASPPQFGFGLTNAFPGLSFSGPVSITAPPGETNRLFILERSGTIVVITNLASPTRTVFMSLTVLSDSESGLIGLAFHPGYATNGYFFVFSSRSLTTSQGSGRHQRISRFQTNPADSNQGLTASELPLITQYDTAGNHNGGDLHFGPDGYLYASLGDEGAQYNGNRNSQMLTKNFFSAILRIDVDKHPGNLLPNPHPANTTNYFIPADNPYIGLTNFNGQTIDPATIRTEFYAIGFRNPWRMSFDRVTGDLYVGDVGQDLYEEVDLITRGGNYGWAYYEGTHLAKDLYPSQTTILTNPPPGLMAPIVEYSHSGASTNIGNAVIGGVVYRGSALSQLYGAYVFGDNGSGNIWMLRRDGTNTVPSQRLTGASGPAAFGVDPRNGDVFIAQLNNNTIGRLIYNGTPSGTALPPTLSDTGAFSDLTSLAPAAGIVPYDINVPFWSDNAIKTRWFSVPGTNLTINFDVRSNWSFPAGAVWIKHFELELTNGIPASRKRLETRFIVRNLGGVYGATYRWDSATNATLVAEGGMDEPFTINDGGILRTQIWHYPSRSECLACHTPQGGFALGFNTAQMNRDFDYGAGSENQIAALSRVGYFAAPVTNLYTLPSLVRPDAIGYSLAHRVRSYLAANCSQCHQPGGPSVAAWDARTVLPLSQTSIINGPLNNDAGDPNNRVIAPGSLANSMMLTRISKRGAGQMPPLDSTLLDTNGINLISQWITNDLPSYQTFSQWQLTQFGSTNSPASAPGADPDGDGAINLLEFLVGTNPTNALDLWKVALRPGENSVGIIFPHIANRGFEVQAASSLSPPVQWQVLDVPDNRPFYSATNFIDTINDALTNMSFRVYRVRIYEP
jgi:glucose/arabinose dehydrogenase/mono/diheme cytochrome c family protein